jgi:hypothetical protein
LKKLLIISPYFPPSNAADMHRVRTSLPYFEALGWDAEIVTVDSRYSDIAKDDCLEEALPVNIKVHRVKAFSKRWSMKVGLGSLALRSLWFYRQKVDQLLRAGQYDLVFFSTTQFPVCILGAYWKRKFGIPYVIDMQDPWHSTYYQDVPKTQRPKKYWFSYRLNKLLEPVAMRQVGGLMAVSPRYIADLKQRYPEIENAPAATIPFGAFAPDIDIALRRIERFPHVLDPSCSNLVYIGRGGQDLHQALSPVFAALYQYLKENSGAMIRLYFIGTSYAPPGEGKQSIAPLAEKHGVSTYVTELTDRVGYYQALATLQQADALLVIGSDDPAYNASKIHPYLLTEKPLLAMLNSNSPTGRILNDFEIPYHFNYDATPELNQKLMDFFHQLCGGNLQRRNYNQEVKEKYSAARATEMQCKLFDEVLNGSH